MTTYKIYQGMNLADGAEIALKRHLHVHLSHYALRGFLQQCVGGHARWGLIVLAFDDDGEAIAVTLVSRSGFCACYVQPAHRRKGIGSKLFEEAANVLGALRYTAWTGVAGSWNFWHSNSVRVT